MATWYVKDATDTSGSNNGTSVADAWQGWSSINWTSVLAGDTIKVVGTITSSANCVTGKSGTSANVITLLPNAAGDGFVFTSGAYISVSYDYWTVNGLSIVGSTAECLRITAVVDYLTLTNNNITAPGTSGINIGVTAGTKTYLIITDNKITGGSAAGINFYANDDTAAILTDSIIARNVISGSGGDGIRIQSHTGTANAAVVQRLTIENNVVSNCVGSGIKVVRKTGSSAAWQDVIVRNNTITNCGVLSAGSGITYSGIASSTSDYGKNIISGNIISNVLGPASGIDALYSSYLDIEANNVSETQSSTTDGSGILIDKGCNYVRCMRNTIRNARGSTNPGTYPNSGAAISVLSATNVTLEGNYSKDCRIGLSWNNVSAGDPSGTARCNTFQDCNYLGVIVISNVTNAAGIVMTNNIFEGPYTNNAASGVPNETYNCVTGAVTGDTLDSTSTAVDPQLSEDGYVGTTNIETGGVWIAGARLYDDLPQPLNPPIGAKARRDYSGRRVSAGGGLL